MHLLSLRALRLVQYEFAVSAIWMWLVQYEFAVSAIWHIFLLSNNIATGYKYRLYAEAKGSTGFIIPEDVYKI